MSVAVLLIAGLVAGDWVLRPFRLSGSVEFLAYRLMVGLCLCATFLLLVGSFSLTTAQLILNGVAVVGLGYELFVYSRRAPSSIPHPTPRQPIQGIEWICMTAIGAALVLALIGALAPATGWDACVAHLALPKDYAREGRIQLLEGNEYSAYPQLLHCLFAGAFLQGGETGVTLLSWSFAALACVTAFGLGSRIESRRCGIIAAAILATAPIFLDQGQTASVDLAFCAFTLAALTCLAAWRDEKRLLWLFLSAYLAGSSCGIRHTGYLVCALLALGTLAITNPGRWRATVWFSVIATLGAAPWLLRSAILVGNPFYPFFADSLGSGRLPHWQVTALASHFSVQGIGLVDLLRFPLDIILRPQLYDGWSKSPGGLVLFLGLPGLLVGGRRARALGAFSGAGLVCFFFFERFARYLLPFFAPMMVVAAIAACRLKTLRPIVAAVLVATLAYGLLLDVAAVHFKGPAALGWENRDQYLVRRVERYPVFRWVNEHIPPSDTVLTFDRRTYYIQGRTFQNDAPLRALSDASIEDQFRWLNEHEIKYVLIPLTYIQESPGLRSPLGDMVRAWRLNSRYFALVQTFDLPRPRSEGHERVEIYAVRDKEWNEPLASDH